MRSTINISMSPRLFSKVKSVVNRYDYSSVSEFVRDAIRAWEEEQLYLSVMKSQSDIAQGKFKKLKSLKDLM